MRFLVKCIEAAGFRVCRFSFCTNYGIIILTNPPGLSKKRIRVDI
nr:MAG TPA: putative S-adenosyl-L-methionine-dependent methyltransferase [Caudoviricetes sp.]